MQRWPVGEEIRWTEGEVHPLVAALPYHSNVPKDPIEHLEYRIQVAKRCLSDIDFRQGMIECCRKDPLLFINLWCWIVEPREGEESGGQIPFRTWRHQDPVIAAIAKYFGRRHIIGDKSRAQGASWILIALFVWRFLFFPNQNLGLGSKNKDTADNPKKHGSLGYKIDYILNRLPRWMVPKYDRMADGKWQNLENNSLITAEAATPDIGRADRFTAFGLDESAYFPHNYDRMAVDNLVATTNGIIMISTPNGTDNEHYDRVTRPSPWLKVVLDWKDNPEQNRGLYTNRGGKREILDKNYHFPADYPFHTDERIRSPWYDVQWDNMKGNPVAMSREYDRDYGGSKGRPFSDTAMAVARKFVREPSVRGRLRFERTDPSDLDSIKFAPSADGPLKLWFSLAEDGLPPLGSYAIACDCAAGTGSDAASNSSIQVFNALGEQVAEFACNRTNPTKLAKLAIAMCYWFGRGNPLPYLNFEKNGPLGTQFAAEAKRLMYPNIYCHVERGRKGSVKRSNKIGYHTTKTSSSLEPLVTALEGEQIVLRSAELVRECSEYEFGPGDWVHPGSRSAMDPADQGLNHGDRAVAAGIAIISLLDRHMLPEIRPRSLREPKLHQAPDNSIAGRWRERQRRDEERRRSKSCVW